jgi:hypothetical protein
MSTISLSEETSENNLDKNINEIFSEQNIDDKKRSKPRLTKKSTLILFTFNLRLFKLLFYLEKKQGFASLDPQSDDTADDSENLVVKSSSESKL